MAVGGKHTVEPAQANSRFRYETGEASDEVQGLQDDVCRVISIRRFEPIAYIPMLR